MLIWILALALLGIFAAIGYYNGAIRTSVLFIGTFIALALAKPMAPLAKSLVPLVGLKNPLWVWFMPQAIVFIVLALVFFGVSFALHRPVALYYKYKTDDIIRLRWERLNHRLGICIGMLTGLVYFFLIAWVVYVAGYLTVQVAADENPPTLKYLNQAREDLSKVGLDRTMAALDRVKPRYYQVADIIGLVYQNPILQSRLSKYPPFLTMGERPEFADIANDIEFNKMLLDKASIATILDNPKTQGLIANDALLEELKQVDLNDLRTYLETGKSPKYSEEKILGRWNLDTDAAVTYVKKKKPDLTGAEMMAVRKAVAVLAGVTLTATVDQKTTMKVDAAAQAAANPQAAPAPAPAPVDPATLAYQQRYGGARPGQRGPAPAVRPKPQAPAEPPVDFGIAPTGEGTWKSDGGGTYEITLPDAKGKPHTLTGTVEEGQLVLTSGAQTLIFNKEE